MDRDLEKYAYPIIGDTAVDEITTENARQVLQPAMATARTVPTLTG